MIEGGYVLLEVGLRTAKYNVLVVARLDRATQYSAAAIV
jgi:hypothetical protein